MDVSNPVQYCVVLRQMHDFDSDLKKVFHYLLVKRHTPAECNLFFFFFYPSRMYTHANAQTQIAFTKSYISKLVTVVHGDPKAPFSIATMQRC